MFRKTPSITAVAASRSRRVRQGDAEFGEFVLAEGEPTRDRGVPGTRHDEIGHPRPVSVHIDSFGTGTVSDDKIRSATVDGGPAVGMSEAMPAYPELKTLPDTLDGLVALIRAFGKLAK